MPDDFPTISSTLSIYCLFTNNNKILIKSIHLNLTRKRFSEKNNSYIYKNIIYLYKDSTDLYYYTCRFPLRLPVWPQGRPEPELQRSHIELVVRKPEPRLVYLFIDARCTLLLNRSFLTRSRDEI